MKGSDIFPSKYIKADDLLGREVPVTISHVVLETLGNDQKPILYFEGKEKGMVCNKTNFGRISYLYGDETDDWVGKPIVLVAEFVEFQGKTVKGLRVRPPANPQRATPPNQAAWPPANPQRAAPPNQAAPVRSENPAAEGSHFDDDIPFAPEWRG